jgi:ABC-type sugar transport system substrate-binding protein
MSLPIKRGGRFPLALALVAASIAAGWSSGVTRASVAHRTAHAAGPTIYVIGYETQNPFWQAEKRGAEAAGRALNSHVIYEAPAVASTAGMESLARAALAAHPQGIAFDYTDRGMERVTLAALNQGVQVVLYNNNRFENTGAPGSATTNPRITHLAYSGQDEHKSGIVLATGFLKYLKPHASILIVNPFPQAFVLTLRYRGLKSVFDAHGFKTTLINGGADEGANMSLVGSFLQSHPGTGAIVGLGDPAGNPAATYLQRHHMKIPVAAFDIDTEALHLIQTGAMTLCLNQQPWLQSYYAVQNLVFRIRFGLQPVNVDTGTLLVSRQNVGQYVRAIQSGHG